MAETRIRKDKGASDEATGDSWNAQPLPRGKDPDELNGPPPIKSPLFATQTYSARNRTKREREKQERLKMKNEEEGREETFFFRRRRWWLCLSSRVKALTKLKRHRSTWSWANHLPTNCYRSSIHPSPTRPRALITFWNYVRQVTSGQRRASDKRIRDRYRRLSLSLSFELIDFALGSPMAAFSLRGEFVCGSSPRPRLWLDVTRRSSTPYCDERVDVTCFIRVARRKFCRYLETRLYLLFQYLRLVTKWQFSCNFRWNLLEMDERRTLR